MGLAKQLRSRPKIYLASKTNTCNFETDGNMLDKMGCKSDAESSTITKRSVEDTEWDSFAFI